MKIRNGFYCKYENLDLKLVETRNDVPIPDDKRMFQLWYEDPNECPFDDFEKDRFGNGFYKIIPINQIGIVSLVFTYGMINGFNIEVFAGKENKIQIASRNIKIAEELGLSNCGVGKFMKQIEISDLDLVWEETIQIKKSVTPLGEVLKLNEIWQVRERILIV
jgi:hypothetical protein